MLSRGTRFIHFSAQMLLHVLQVVTKYIFKYRNMLKAHFFVFRASQNDLDVFKIIVQVLKNIFFSILSTQLVHENRALHGSALFFSLGKTLNSLVN